MDYVFDDDEVDRLVGRMWRSTDPGSLLHNAWVAYHHHRVVLYCADIAITRVTSDSDTAQLARDAEYLDWLKPRLAKHDGFIALLAYYPTLGIEGRFTGHDGYSAQATNWGMIVPRESLPRLERLAQDRAGLTTPEARATAAAAFRIYMARHYDSNWEENRRTMPPIDRSPYWRSLD
jgi:hypothetical protein